MELTGKPQVMVADATNASIADFHNDGQRLEDLQEYMNGTPHQQGGQHDMDSRGITSDRGEWQQSPEALAAAVQETQFLNDPTTPQGQPQFQPQVAPQEDSAWRRRYGQSENEKGELRAALNQQLEMNQKLMELAFGQPQLQQPNYSTPQPQWNGNVGYSQVAPQVQAPQPYQVPQRFVAKPDGEMFYAEDAEALSRNVFAPALFENHQRTEAALSRVAQLEARLAQEERSRMGITPQLEAQALVEQPWLRNLRSNPDVSAYHGALSNYKQVLDARALATRGPQLQSQAPLPGTSQAAARRITYIESSGGQHSGMEPGQGPTDFQRDFAAAQAAPHALKGARMREVFQKYGINSVNDFGDRQILTR